MFVSIVYIILFIIIMVVVFSMGMLVKIIDRKEIIILLASSFIIGIIGGMFFLYPVYEDVPYVTGYFNSLNPDNEEKLYLDISSIKLENLLNTISNTDGIKSYEITGITFHLWRLTDSEVSYLNNRIGYIDDNYVSWNVTNAGVIDIKIKNGTDPLQALKSFSDWYKLVYGDNIKYGQVYITLVVKSSEVENVKVVLFEDKIVPINSEGPVEDSINNTKESMLNYNEFAFVTGIFSMLIAVLGIYYDTMVVYYRKFLRFINNKRK